MGSCGYLVVVVGKEGLGGGGSCGQGLREEGSTDLHGTCDVGPQGWWAGERRVVMLYAVEAVGAIGGSRGRTAEKARATPASCQDQEYEERHAAVAAGALQ